MSIKKFFSYKIWIIQLKFDTCGEKYMIVVNIYDWNHIYCYLVKKLYYLTKIISDMKFLYKYYDYNVVLIYLSNQKNNFQILNNKLKIEDNQI